MKYRLDRLLTELVPELSRKQAKDAIRAGRVTIDGVRTNDPERKTDPEAEVVALEGRPLAYAQFRYFLLNKPAGVLSATRDKKQKTVLDLISGIDKEKYFPVGRLDIDTEGLLLITNDGALSHELLSPKKHVEKEYIAVCRGILTDDTVAPLRTGVDLGDFTTAPAKVKVLSADSTAQTTELSLAITEGKFHQVKRMVAAVGSEVLHLRRIRMGGMSLPQDLKEGEYRELSAEDLRKFREIIGGNE